MCGIVGGITSKDVKEYIIKGLKSLEYRGYDSAGIALVNNGKIDLIRVKGGVDLLEKAVENEPAVSVGVGHTRWATHGEPSVKNAHPQNSMNGVFSIVHNGVIDNFRTLKAKLIDKGYVFKSDTDTEVIANLIEYYYFKDKQSVLQAIQKTLKEVRGSYALAVLFKADEEHIYFAKMRSPLVIGRGSEGMYLGSDYMPMVKEATDFYTVLDGQYGYITKQELVVFKDGSSKPLEVTYHQTEIAEYDLGLEGYPHYMLKEIEESPQVVRRLIDNYYDGSQYLFDKNLIKTIKKAPKLIFIAAGTSYHASLIARRYFFNYGKNVDVFVASEWAYYPYVTDPDSIFIFVSQSGETADLIRCVDIVKERGGTIVTVTNSKGSTLDRLSDFTLLLYAGYEVSVASTKAYTAQVTLFSLLIGALRDNHNSIGDFYAVIKAQEAIMKQKEDIQLVAKDIAKAHDVYFLGRGLDHDVALEASLKLKEITYLHSEAFAGGELKHGPIALITKESPVIGFVSDPLTAEAIRSNFEEVKARGAKVYIISPRSLSKEGDKIVVPTTKNYLSPLTMGIVGQYLAYYVALELGTNIDKPRNLAKSVTVE
ncbi:MAG TPA: glutamine--fructose-6-phosphate transaminase (isomerizing) [Bacilli bacterium]|nr:glutamine--fructose-6-phosphate transaminase (isomerizing) [Bacilli bacterium]